MPRRSSSVRSVQGTIKYQLSAKGRRDSLLSGGDGKREQEQSGPVDESILGSFTLADDGSVSYDLAGDIYQVADDEIQLPPACSLVRDFRTDLYWDKVPTWDDLIAVVREIDRVTALENELTKESAAEFTSNPQARASQINAAWANIGGRYFAAESELFGDVYREAVRRREADVAALKKRNRASLAKWIEGNGTPNQRERLAAGLLPWKEAHEAIDASFFDDDYLEAVEGVQLYARFDNAAVCVCPRQDEQATCDLKYQASDATELTASEWEQLSLVKKVFDKTAKDAGASVEYQYREHSAKCVTAPEALIRRGVIVKITLDQLTFKRELALTVVPYDND